MLACSNSSMPVGDNAAQVSKVCVLFFLLLLVMMGNAVLFHQTDSKCKRRRWNASMYILKLLAACGFLNGAVTIPVFICNIIMGSQFMGPVSYPVYGVVNNVLLTSWVWMLTLAAMERYTKLIVPAEHGSLFSTVNTKIMAWGIVLLLLVIYLGPIYGWGEYSQMKGKLDLLIQLTNATVTSPELTLTSALSSYYMYLFQTQGIANGTIAKLGVYMENTFNASLQTPVFGPLGITVPLQLPGTESLSCLWSQQRSAAFSEDLDMLFVENNAEILTGLVDVKVTASLKHKDYEVYRDVFIPFQEATACTLDYSSVSRHVNSFVIFTWIFTLILPFLLMLFFYVRQLCANTVSDSILSDSSTNSGHEQMLALTSLSTLLCYVPHYTASLLAGRGYPVASAVHFTASVMLCFSFSLVFLISLLSGSLTSCASCFCTECVRSTPSCTKFSSPSRQKLLNVRRKDTKEEDSVYGCVHMKIRHNEQMSPTCKSNVNETML